MAENELIFVRVPGEVVTLERANTYFSAANLSHTRVDILAQQGDPYPESEGVKATIPQGYVMVRIGLYNPVSRLREFRRKVDLFDDIKRSTQSAPKTNS